MISFSHTRYDLHTEISISCHSHYEIILIADTPWSKKPCQGILINNVWFVFYMRLNLVFIKHALTFLKYSLLLKEAKNKNPPTWFFNEIKVWRKHSDHISFSPLIFWLQTNSICETTYFWKMIAIDRMQHWLSINYSFIFVLISLASLVSMRKIQENFHTKMRLISNNQSIGIK